MKGLKKGPTKVVGVYNSYPYLLVKRHNRNIRKHVIEINIIYVVIRHTLVNDPTRNCIFSLVVLTRSLIKKYDKYDKKYESNLSFVLFNSDPTGLISLINVCSAIS